MNAAFSEIQDGAFSHLPLLQFLYAQGAVEGRVAGLGSGRAQMWDWVSLQKIQVSLTFAQIGEPEKVEQHEVRRGEEAVGEKKGRGCM